MGLQGLLQGQFYLTLGFLKRTGLLVTMVQPGGVQEGLEVTVGSPSEVCDMGLGHRVI